MILTQQVRRPLVGIALSVAAGLGFQHGVGGSPLLLLIVAAFLLAIACRIPLFFCSTPLIYLLFGLLAASYGAMESMPSSSRTALMTAEVIYTEQELIGTIQEEPNLLEEEDGAGNFIFRADAVRFGEKWLPVDAVLRVYLNDNTACVRFGEQWRLKGRYAGYEKPRGGTAGVLTVPVGGAVRLRASGTSLLRSCYQVRGKASEILRTGIEPFTRHIQLLRALMLGYRQSIPPELYQLCSRAGVLHIFAISGMHVVVMASILIMGLKFIGVSRPQWGWLLIPALFLYVISTGMKPSALRALAMSAVFFAAPLLRRRPDTPSAIALAAVLLLIMDPANIADPGFLLSFIVVCGLIMVHGWTIRQIAVFRSSGWEHQLERLDSARPVFVLLRNTGALMLTSLAAWLFSAPITACFFYSLSPVALIANLPVIPLTSMIMFTGCLALLSGMVFLPAAALFNQANLLFINLLIWIIGWFSALPGAYRAVRMPSAWATGLWYTGLTLFFTGPSRWRKGAVLLVLLSVFAWQAGGVFPCRDIQVFRDKDFAMLVRFPGNQWELVTDGDSFRAGRVLRFVQKQGINRLHTLVVSDANADAETVRRIQETFRPQYTRFLFEGEIARPVEQGIVRIPSIR
ncbi:MAG: ComEC family competence protein [Pontiellaceae bacterium]|jgi:competence protein ComEC|nr:ComEC family competence protein [Pontiellaceae bacterium]